MYPMNLVYCFDSNYNIQAICSILSILNKIDDKVQIYIIHDDPKSFHKEFEIYKNHENLISYEVFEFKSDSNFPGIKNSHVSNATYFRLYISTYLPKEVKSAVYLDPDVICIRDFFDPLTNLINKLEKSDFIISALSTPVNKQMQDTLMKPLMIDEKYFNAGVMLIDLAKWNKFDLEKQLMDRLNLIKENITYWDQDVLNSFFNGNYLELPKSMNYMLASTNTTRKYFNEIKRDVFFVHYAGDLKPWTVKGGLFKTSKFYHDSFLELSLDKYHITNKYKFSTFSYLINGIISLKIFNLKYPFRYIFQVLKILFNK